MSDVLQPIENKSKARETVSRSQCLDLQDGDRANELAGVGQMHSRDEICTT